MYVNSIVDEEGRELLKKPYTCAISRAKLTSSTIPAAREGYKGGIIQIELDKLKRKIDVGEYLTCDVRFTTGDGAKTKLVIHEVLEPTRDIPVTLSQSWNEARGLLTVTAVNTGSVAITSVGSNISYTYNGKKYSITPYKTDINLSGTSYFYYLPPIGIPLNIYLSEEDAQDFKDTESITNLTLNAKGYRLNNINKSSISALC